MPSAAAQQVHLCTNEPARSRIYMFMYVVEASRFRGFRLKSKIEIDHGTTTFLRNN